MRLKRVDALGCVALDSVALNRALVFQQNGIVVNNAIRYIRRHLQTYHYTAGGHRLDQGRQLSAEATQGGQLLAV